MHELLKKTRPVLIFSIDYPVFSAHSGVTYAEQSAQISWPY